MPKFKPPYFLEICKSLLKNKHDEASIRTVIGRSYYTAFLYCREYLEKIGIEFPSSIRHGDVWEKINERSTKIGSKLNGLFICRLVSDYDLSTPNTRPLYRSGTTITSKCDYNEAKQCLVSVIIIIDNLEKNP